jgi:predicted nucleotidyltransferase
LKRIYELTRETRRLRRFILFGSFVTRKPEPGDIDIFLIMDSTFNVTEVEGSARRIFDHAIAQAEWEASVFWARQEALLTNEETAIAYWQIKRDRSQRGIIEVVSE